MNGWQTFLIILGAIILVGFIVFILRKRLTEITLDAFKIFKINAKAKGCKRQEIHIDTQKKFKSDQIEKEYMSHAVLKGLQIELKKTLGQHAILETTRQNLRTTAHLYSNLQGDIIGTCFFENPDYGPNDLSESIRKGSRFYRLTLRDLCSDKSEAAISGRFNKHPSKQSLIVLDNNVEISKIGGIFCECDDKSHLAFIALNNFCGANTSNQGIVFCGDIAEAFFNYYNSFVKKYV